MSSHRKDAGRRLAAPDITARKGQTPIVCLTAYTAPMAELLDAHCDLLLVGDSVGMVVHGLPNTVGVTLDMMIMHGQAVMRGSKAAMVVVDMPFGSYEGAAEEAYANAARIMKETGGPGCEGRGGLHGRRQHRLPGEARRAGDGPRGPASPGRPGGRRLQGQGPDLDERRQILEDARATAEAGAFAIVVEGVPRAWPARSPRRSRVPTIGIGASAGCDGQILVTDDMLGLFDWTPKFVRRYADLRGEITRAVGAYAEDVRARRFPGPAEIYFAKAG